MPVGAKVIAIKNKIEGRYGMAKDGTVSFADSTSNVEGFLSIFPNAEIRRIATLSDNFDDFVGELKRPKFVYKREPLHWQKSAHEKIVKIKNDKDMHRAFAFFYDPGAGKSKSLTDMNTYLYCEGDIDAAIILTPNVLVGDQWSRVDEGEGGALQRDIHDSIKNKAWLWNRSQTKKSKEAYEIMTNFDGIQTVVMNVDAVKTPAGFKLLESFIKRHRGRVNFGVDEIHMIGNPSSQRHKACLKLADMCKWRAGLTGTPITKDLISIFGIFKFLNEKIIGYKYITGFKRQYCEMRWNGFADQIVGHKNIEQLYERIEAYSSRISQKEMGLEKVYDEFVFDMSPEQTKHFNLVKQQWLTKLDNGEFATASIALSAALKLQQISNGFLIGDDGTVQYLDNGRITALESWLETIPEGEKVVIWCRFKIDAQQLMKKFGDKAVDLSGNVSQKQRTENKDLFISDENIRFCIATPDAAGTGTDGLQHVCNRAVYYSSSEHYVNRKQSEDRVLRVGGESVAFYTDLIARNSPDRKILRNLKGKKDLSSYTLDDVREMFS